MLEYILIAAVCVFIVDVSGFTESWRGAVQRWTGVRELRRLKPFDCSLCLTWWSCLVYGWICHGLTLGTVAWSVLAAALTPAILALWNALASWVLAILGRITIKADKYNQKSNEI